MQIRPKFWSGVIKEIRRGEKKSEPHMDAEAAGCGTEGGSRIASAPNKQREARVEKAGQPRGAANGARRLERVSKNPNGPRGIRLSSLSDEPDVGWTSRQRCWPKKD